MRQDNKLSSDYVNFNTIGMKFACVCIYEGGRPSGVVVMLSEIVVQRLLSGYRPGSVNY